MKKIPNTRKAFMDVTQHYGVQRRLLREVLKLLLVDPHLSLDEAEDGRPKLQGVSKRSLQSALRALKSTKGLPIEVKNKTDATGAWVPHYHLRHDIVRKQMMAKQSAGKQMGRRPR